MGTHIRTRRRHLLGLAGALLAAATSLSPAAAQPVPLIPPMPPIGTGCIVAGTVAPCAGLVIPEVPIVVVVPERGAIGGPVFGSGGRNVQVERDVDRSRTPGRVVVR